MGTLDCCPRSAQLTPRGCPSGICFSSSASLSHQVLPIWEGTTNILCLDVLRCILKSQGKALDVFFSTAQVSFLQTPINEFVTPPINVNIWEAPSWSNRLSQPRVKLRRHFLALTCCHCRFGTQFAVVCSLFHLVLSRAFNYSAFSGGVWEKKEVQCAFYRSFRKPRDVAPTRWTGWIKL